MSLTPLNPEALWAPAGPYAHGILIDPGMRWLVTTGQVALAKDRSIPEGAEAQCRLIWNCLEAILAEAGMAVSDIVRLGVYATSAEALAAHNGVRNEKLGAATPATTAIIVAALANPKFLVEVEIMACRRP